MIPSYQIRKATSADLVGIQALLNLHDLPGDDVEEHLHHFLVVEINGTIAGTVGMELYERTALMRSVAVATEFQHKGLGDKLVTTMSGYAKEHGADEIVLLTTTAEDYFARKGFSRIDRKELTGPVLRSRQFTVTCPSSATTMQKRL